MSATPILLVSQKWLHAPGGTETTDCTSTPSMLVLWERMNRDLPLRRDVHTIPSPGTMEPPACK